MSAEIRSSRPAKSCNHYKTGPGTKGRIALLAENQDTTNPKLRIFPTQNPSPSQVDVASQCSVDAVSCFSNFLAQDDIAVPMTVEVIWYTPPQPAATSGAIATHTMYFQDQRHRVMMPMAVYI
jgi:hypothetical protein